jgi:hypothetical protein
VVAGGLPVDAVWRSPEANAQNMTPRSNNKANAIPAIAPAVMPSLSAGGIGLRGSFGS